MSIWSNYNKRAHTMYFVSSTSNAHLEIHIVGEADLKVLQKGLSVLSRVGQDISVGIPKISEFALAIKLNLFCQLRVGADFPQIRLPSSENP